MIAEAGAVKTRVLREIDKRQDEFVDLCCRIVRFNTENPPGGNTAEAAAFIADLLRRRGVAVHVVEPQAGVASLTATLAGRRASPHFVLNGHLDVFPSDDPGLWDYPPFCGEVLDGKILGRGVADMKAGTAASLCAFLVAADLSLDLPGRLTLTIVSDEETGGRWGTEWLLSHNADLAGDGCLIGEPCGPDAVRVGEKGLCWMRMTSSGESFHASFSTGENAITRLASGRFGSDHHALAPARSRPPTSQSARSAADEGPRGWRLPPLGIPRRDSLSEVAQRPRDAKPLAHRLHALYASSPTLRISHD